VDLGTIASLVGLGASVVIAAYQHRQAQAARRETAAEKNRAATLEGHLTRQRWQQLRSIAEQIDAIERTGRMDHSPAEAAIHARLKEQFASLLGVIATSTGDFNAATVRHWIDVGRLRRPWQIAEAVSHLDALPGADPNQQGSLRQLLSSTGCVPPPQPLRLPTKPDLYVAAVILIASHYESELVALLPQGGQIGYSLAVFFHLLAVDCARLATIKNERVEFYCWGSKSGRSFAETVKYYESMDFWLVATAKDEAQSKLGPFRHLFEPGQHALVPTTQAVEMARTMFPELVALVPKVAPPVRGAMADVGREAPRLGAGERR
jgi:hypothetical protein